MLAEPERTPYDLRFRLLGFPVRVHPWFWLGTVLFGSRYLDDGPEFLLIWVAVVFVSILVHELGHALAFRLYGSDADIVLYAFGGLAVPTAAVSGRWRRVAIALAGPVAGFVLAGAVFGSNLLSGWVGQVKDDRALFLYGALLFVNVWWGIFNLIPVFPLDGGQVARELCGMVWGTRGKRISLKISFVVALVMAVYALLCVLDRGPAGGFLAQLPAWARIGSVYTAILFGLLAYTSYQLLQERDWADDHWDDKPPWAR